MNGPLLRPLNPLLSFVTNVEDYPHKGAAEGDGGLGEPATYWANNKEDIKATHYWPFVKWILIKGQ